MISTQRTFQCFSLKLFYHNSYSTFGHYLEKNKVKQAQGNLP